MTNGANQPRVYHARGGESLCHVATAYGFPNCQRVRDANPDLRDRKVLRRRDEVTIPPLEEGEDGAPDRTRNRFRRPGFPPPRAWFIKETGAGYPDEVPDPDERGYDPHYPNSDPKLRELNISNYHPDRAGDGLGGTAFAAHDFYGNDSDSSLDPDHFKVQVYDNKVSDGVNDVDVTLHAMRPGYRRVTQRGHDLIAQTTNWYYPTTDDRKLDITCRRVGQTNYFRSPYLRLVTSESDRNARLSQALLVKDYWDDGADDDQKRFTEILHHKIRIVYHVKICSVNKCEVTKDARLDADREVRFAVHNMSGSGVTSDDLRTQIFKWMRRTLAQTHVKPHLKLFHTVDVPENMITVADSDGRHASGVAGGGARPPRSQMTVTIGGTDYTHTPRAGDSPRTTANKLKRLLTRNRYRVRGPYRTKVSGLTPVRGQVSSPYDILVFDRSRNRVSVDSVAYTDVPVGGRRGQSLIVTDDIDVENFEVDWPYQGRWPRSMNHNYRSGRYFNIFVCGTNLTGVWNGGGLLGFGPYGFYDRNDTDIGPIAFINKPAVNGVGCDPYTMFHEMLHPLMHVIHATPGSELMFATAGNVESVDAPKRVSDAPIGVSYDVLFRSGSENIVLNGQRQNRANGRRYRSTPVRRFLRVAASYGYLKRPSRPRVDQS